LESLKEIAQIQFGYYEPPSEHGTIPYLQVKHFDNNGRMTKEIDTFVEDTGKLNQYLLEEGDILFTSKGYRFQAIPFKKLNTPAVASSIFFIIRPNRSKIVPGYLAAILNQPENLRHFQKSGAGSSIPSIRKSELADFKIPMPDLDTQRRIANVLDLFNKELELLDLMMKQKKELYHSILSKLMTAHGTE
jgi:restriction endonuclease S subunit